MKRGDVNRSGELEAFVAAVDRGSLASAARALGLTASAMSKLLARLEARLGVRLLQRSTRKLQLTEEGRKLYERGVRVLADLDEAERAVAANAEPRGRVRLNTSVAFGQHVLLPLVPRLLAQHPGLSVDIALTDRVIDLVEEGADIAIRWGPLASSELVARSLGATGQVIVGSPEYLARCGTPETPSALRSHQRLGFSQLRSASVWPLSVRKRTVHFPVEGGVRAGDGESLRLLALAGAGLARLSRFQVQADLDAGRLVAVLQALNPGDRAPISAVYLGKPGRLPARVRAVLDFLQQHAAIREP